MFYADVQQREYGANAWLQKLDGRLRNHRFRHRELILQYFYSRSWLWFPHTVEMGTP